MRGTLFIIMVFLGLSSFAQTNLNNCLELSKQLEQMVNAQNRVFNSLVKKNEAVAQTLETFANDLGNDGQRVKKADLISLRQSAKSFRGQSLRESELIEKFNQQSEHLVEKIAQCLQQSRNPVGVQQAKVVQDARDSNNQSQQ